MRSKPCNATKRLHAKIAYAAQFEGGAGVRSAPPASQNSARELPSQMSQPPARDSSVYLPARIQLRQIVALLSAASGSSCGVPLRTILAVQRPQNDRRDRVRSNE